VTVHATIDIETLGTKPDTTVLTIGAVKFNPFTKEDPYADLYLKVDADQQLEAGRSVDEDTLKWWTTQPQEIQDEAFLSTDRTSVEDTLAQLNKYLVGVDKIWCQGPVFDICILENLYRQYDKHFNWVFWNIRDSRTLFGLMPEDPRKKHKFAAHNALEDCRIQSKCIQEVYAELQLTR
jgi:hypothetical protein